MSKRLSIIIPTHERDHLLERALAYYSNFDRANIIICDSSIKPSSKTISREIIYYHLPGYSFASKLLYAVERVSTPYSCLSADDDFLVESSLMTAAYFLEYNKDYVAINGQYILFNLKGNQEILFNLLYNGLSKKNREHQDARERVVNSLTSSPPLMLGLFRSEILKNSIQAATHTTRITNVEIACNIVPMIFGKSKKLPIFWMARDAKRYTCYNISGDNNNSVVNDYSKYMLTDDGLRFRKIIADLIAEILKMKVNDATLLFDKSMNSYLTLINNKQQLNTKRSVSARLKLIIKKAIPKAILYIKNKRMMAKIIIGEEKLLKTEDFIKIENTVKEFGDLKGVLDLRL